MKTGRVYFLQRHDGLVKIGFTTNLDQRIRDLSSAHGPLAVLRVLNGDKRLERKLHQRFKELREYGEWFRGEPYLVRFAKTVTDGEAVFISLTERHKRWREGEQAVTDEAMKIADKLVANVKARHSISRDAALAYIEDTYGIGVGFMRNMISGKAASISAYGLQRLSSATHDELMAYRRDILDQMERAETERSKRLQS